MNTQEVVEELLEEFKRIAHRKPCRWCSGTTTIRCSHCVDGTTEEICDKHAFLIQKIEEVIQAKPTLSESIEALSQRLAVRIKKVGDSEGMMSKLQRNLTEALEWLQSPICDSFHSH